MTPIEKPPGLERFSLSGRVALVTGATRGLGLEIACGMAAAGAMVGINGRSAERAGEIAKTIPNAVAAPFDPGPCHRARSWPIVRPAIRRRSLGESLI